MTGTESLNLSATCWASLNDLGMTRWTLTSEIVPPLPPPGTERSTLVRARGGDTLAVRREVASPGGSTARGLAALEEHGVRTALMEAMRAVMQA